ncbi:MAG TPA: rod shape-determining protein MreC [Candidatus Pacearchaeota archaeon]|nr:rod shape-determining protein MreC [Candidatus Pacearchaeota archaeon]HQI74735.1 rod shape-determining protein MreC [Candidatus Pacearchaeota archaeon]
MIYYFGKKAKIVFSAFLLALILLLFNKPIKNLYLTASIPLQQNFFKQGNAIYDFFDYFKNASNFQKENQDLKKKIFELESKNIELESLKKENQDLKQALNLEITEKYKLISTQIIKKEIDRDIILINKGETDGVLIGMTVITPENILVGKVIKVLKSTSQVQLLSDNGFAYNIKFQHQKIDTLGKGAGNGKILLELLPKEELVDQEDNIISSNTGGIFPEGFLIGKINKIEKKDVDPFQKIQITPFYKYKDNYNLFLIFDR